MALVLFNSDLQWQQVANQRQADVKGDSEGCPTGKKIASSAPNTKTLFINHGVMQLLWQEIAS